MKLKFTLFALVVLGCLLSSSVHAVSVKNQSSLSYRAPDGENTDDAVVDAVGNEIKKEEEQKAAAAETDAKDKIASMEADAAAAASKEGGEEETLDLENIETFFSAEFKKTPFQKELEKKAAESASSNSTEAAGEEESEEEASGMEALIFKIIKYSTKISEEKPVDEEKRKILSGNLPNYYPKKQRELAQKAAKSDGANASIMKYITEPYRFCIFPYFSTNAMSYCSQSFATSSQKRTNDCKCMMCMTCCDNVLQVLKLTASKSIVSQILGLAEDAGYAKIKGVITSDEINQCRQLCQEEYPMERPVVLPPPPKDSKLGKSKDAPGLSCIDIKMNGKDVPSGVYWVGTEGKPTKEIYCDMETDGGGWGLMYNYVHHPYEDYQLDGTKLPLEPDSAKSHMHLLDAGFADTDVAELRFFCQTKYSSEVKVVHFKTHDANVISTALTGSQAGLTPNSWKKTAQNLNLPGNDPKEKLVPLQTKVDTVNSDKEGGFWNNPMGQNGQAYWTIKGAQVEGGKWQCGDSLNDIDGGSKDTLHQVWFRGAPPSKDFVTLRLQKRALDAPAA